MKRIASEDQVQAESAHGTGSGAYRSVPQSGVYIPNYQGVNQLLFNPGGSGRIQFMSALGQMSQEAMQQQQQLYDSIEVSKSVANVDLAFRQKQEEFLQSTPNGQGLTEFATSTYKDLSDNAISQATNSNVTQQLRRLFISRQKDIANSSFKTEKELYTGYAISETETQLTATLNDVVKSPDQVESLGQKYMTQVSSMQNILSNIEFNAYVQKKEQDFKYFYGLGLVKKDPYQALQAMNGDFFQTLDPKKHVQLYNQAKGEIEHRQRQALRIQALQRHAQHEQEQLITSDIRVKIAEGSISRSDIEELDISQTAKNNLIASWISHDKAIYKRLKTQSELDQAVSENKPMPHISATMKNRYLNEHLVSADEQNTSEGKPPLTMCQKVEYCKEHASVFDVVNPALKNNIIRNIRLSTDSQTILDNCVAIAGNTEGSVPAIHGIDEDISDFAELAVTMYEGNKDITSIKELRDNFFKKDKAVIELNSKLWQDTEYAQTKTKAKALDEFYANQGIAFEPGFFTRLFTSNEEINASQVNMRECNAKVLNIIHRTFLRTGSTAQGEAIATKYLNKVLKKTSINGVESYMFNPPTPENTHMTMKEISREIEQSKAKLRSKVPADRKLFIEAASLSKPIYNFFYLLDPKDKDSKQYILKKNGTRVTLSLFPEKSDKQSREK